MKRANQLKRVFAVVLLTALSLAPIASASNMPLPSPEATSSITAADLKMHLSFLASDELGGRYTLSQGNLIAARYLASRLEHYGYHGAAEGGSFFQKVPLSYNNVDSENTKLSLTVGGGKKEFKYADDFAAQSPVNTNLSGDLVFVGYGVSSPGNNHDDYANVDVKGKIVVILGIENPLKNVKLSEDEHGEKAAIKHGAIGGIAIVPNLLSMWPRVKMFATRQGASLPPKGAEAGSKFPAVLAGPALVKALAEAMGKEEAFFTKASGDAFKPMAIPAKAALNMSVEVKEAPPAQNVAGILEGSDPKLKDQYVVFSAHYDHLQTGKNGEIYNGADDDGSGTVAVLEIAEALSISPRPKRSILIIFHTGEEMGLLGSSYNTDYKPVVPLEKLVADFNIDMIGRTRTPDDSKPSDKELTDKDSVYIIGADKLSTELNKISEQTNKDTAHMNFDYTYNDENHPQRFYYRSDHYNYAKHGIPIIFYFTGVHEDYHRPTDDVDKIDFQKMERITRMVFATGWRVANLDHRLVVDKKPAADAAVQ